MSSIDINIKRLRNKYDCNLSSIIEYNGVSILYEGYEINNTVNNEVIVEAISGMYYKNLKPINHPNIIQIKDRIYENNTYYLIYDNYKRLSNIDKLEDLEFSMFFRTFQNIIVYLVENNIEIEPIRLEDIYKNSNEQHYFLIKNIRTNKNINYGSPIYSPILKLDEVNLATRDVNLATRDVNLATRLIWNFGVIIYEILKDPINKMSNIKDIKDIYLHFSTIIELEDSSNKLLNLFFRRSKLTFDEFKNINPDNYTITRDKRSNSVDDMFAFDF
jgi:hypothetical protein